MKVDVETIRARADAATPGPWEQRENRDEGHGVSTVDPLWPGRGHDIVCLGSDGLFADLVFIAHARADVPALCGALEHERRVSEAWRALAAVRAKCSLYAHERFVRAADPMGPEILEARQRLRALGIDPEAP